MLVDHTLFGVVDKTQIALERIRAFEPPAGYRLAFSGGKDSVVLYDLAVRAGVRFDAHYSITTVDPPELVHFIKREYPNVVNDRPRYTMWQLIAKNATPPTRSIRYCCAELKEISGRGRVVLLGVRRAESFNRRNRAVVEKCHNHAGTSFVNPIVDWAEADVWEYIRANTVPYCELYDEGWKRLGCIGCPLAGGPNMERQFARWPKYRAAYVRALERAIQTRIARGLDVSHPRWASGEAALRWWIAQGHNPDGETPGVCLFADAD